jgi:tRNA nucleotidyltransferase (CCA-adding enzyme)
MNLDPILSSAIKKLAPKVPRALLVGGAVRDLLLGVETKDADVEVYGVESDELEKILRELFTQVDIVGASFGIYKVSLEDGRMLDVAIPRRESKTGKGHKGFEVIGDPQLEVTEALRRRDFTVNALALDVATDEIIDPFNGRDDLAKNILRIVDEKTFIDDPLRVFRGIQFAARFGLVVEPKTFTLMKNMVERGDLDELSKERVTDEWRKLLLKSPQPSLGFTLMRELDIVPHYYPELAALIGTPQEKEWHPEGDVWTHTLMVIDEAVQLRHHSVRLTTNDHLAVMLGSLCHDFGKPLTTKTVDGKIRSHGHEEAGVLPAKSFLSRFTFGDDLTRDVAAITRDHLKPTILYRSYQKGELNEKTYANAARRLLKRLGSVSLDVYLTVTEADTRGRGLSKNTGPYDPGAFLRSTVKKFDLEVAAKSQLLTGAELIAEFGFKEGIELGEMLKKIEGARDDGELETAEQARAFVKANL